MSCYSLRPKNPAVLAAFGFELIRVEKYERAIEILEQLTEVAPKYFMGFSNLSTAYSKANLISDANAHHRTSNRLKREFADDFLLRAKLYRKTNWVGTAQSIEALFADFIEKEPADEKDESIDQFVAPDNERSLEQLEDAIEEAVTEIAKKPKYAPHYITLPISTTNCANPANAMANQETPSR